MRAIVFHEHGTLENVQLATVPEPVPGPGELLIQVEAAALNRLDLWVLEGLPGLKLKLPHVMGCDGAGTIAAIGPEVDGWAVGDRVAVDPTVGCMQCVYCRRDGWHRCRSMAVLGEHLPGFYAEYAVVPARNAIRLPDHVPFATAAAASLVFVTAWHSLIERGRLRAGEDVLVVGAGGGVNTAAIQIARLAGAGRIFVVGSSAEKLALAGTLGADVLINRREEPKWDRRVFAETGRLGVDVVVDNVGAATYARSLRALKKGGRLLTVGNTSGPVVQLDNRYMFGKHLSLIGSTMGPHSAFEEVMSFVFAGRLTPVIDTVYPLAQGLTALRRLEAGDVTGKLVLR